MAGFWNSNVQIKIILSLINDGHIGKRSQLWCKFLGKFFCSLVGWCLVSSPLSAQITPDGTLGTEVNTVDSVTEITGGTEANSNLFHSFQDFSLSTGNTAAFDNSLDIDNIIGRITGNNISEINGLIRANGNANLILINPMGISFGEGASLDIGGSFLGSTAESVIFEDGTVFNTDAAAESLITVSAPIGLQLGQNSAAIEVSGAGYELNSANSPFSPIILGEQSRISVQPGNTLALLGRGITIDGGIVAAPGGKIELGSVVEGIVNLDLADSQMSLSYNNVTNLGNLELRSQSLADASGTEFIPSGSIQVRGRQLSLSDGSLLLIQNQLAGTAGTITVDTSESIAISGTNSSGTVPSSIKNETLRSARESPNLEQTRVGNIAISTGELIVEQGASISSVTSNNTKGGNITVNASTNILVQGFSQINPNSLSFISTSSFGTGDAGDINLSTAKLTVLDGARIGAGSFDTGLGGEINVQASDLIEVTGAEPSQFAASLIGASSLGAGSAGNVNLDTARLALRDGGRVDSSAAAVGSAGDVNIQATKSIEISGQTLGTNEPSRISSGANIEDEIARQFFQLPDIPSGDAGSVVVDTEGLQITDRGEISVINSGSGNGGRLEIDAERVFLDRQGVITAATQSGEGGNILLNADSVIWQGRSLTTATAAGNGDGGNITINADSIVALEGSQVTADAFMGMGGNVEIDAGGLIICQSCQVSASSRLGIDGVVNIETLEPTTIDLLEVPQQPTQPQEEVAVACPNDQDASVSQLTITGRGGLPNRPQKTLNAESLVKLAPAQKKRSPAASKNTLPLPARSWYKNAQGNLVLTAQAASGSSNLASTPPGCRLP